MKAAGGERYRALGVRNGGKEVLPVFPRSYHGEWEGHKEINDVGRLPFIRNSVASYYDIEAVMGEPFEHTSNATVQHYSLGTGSDNVRPYDRTPSHGGEVSASDFMGTFLNAFIALDVPEWDIKSLMEDIERPTPMATLKYLTEMLDSRFMNARRLPDEDIAGILEYTTNSREAGMVFDFALERHSPGMKALCVLHKKNRKEGVTQKAFKELLSRGVKPDLPGVNALLKSMHRGTASECLPLYQKLRSGGFADCTPDIESFNATLRVIARNSPLSDTLSFYEDNLDALEPNTFTLNCLLRAVRDDPSASFGDAAAIFDALCLLDTPQQISDGTPSSSPPPLTTETIVTPSMVTWEIMLSLTKSRGMELLYTAHRMTEVVTKGRKGGVVVAQPSVWRFPMLKGELNGLIEGFVPEVDEKTPRGAQELISAYRVVVETNGVDSVLGSLAVFLLDAVWLDVLEYGFATTPALFREAMLAYEAAGDLTKLLAVYDRAAQTPFIQDVHHNIRERAIHSREDEDGETEPEVRAA